MFSNMMNDKVKLVKKNGNEFDNIKANVQTEKIFINDETLPIEEGDKILRELPNGLLESYIVLDRGFYNVKMGGMKSHYQCKVKKESAISPVSKSNSKVVYNVTGENSRINVDSTDNSTNVINMSSDDLFDEIIEVVKENINQNDEIVNSINEMKKNKDDNDRFMNSYQKFISLMADHMSLIKPFIPALSQFFL